MTESTNPNVPTNIQEPLPGYRVRDHAPVRELDGDPAVSLTALHRIEQQCLRALHFSYGSRSNLRAAMQRLARRIHAFGASRRDGHRLIRMLVEHLSDGVSRPSLIGAPEPQHAICEFMIRSFDAAFDAAFDDAAGAPKRQLSI